MISKAILLFIPFVLMSMDSPKYKKMKLTEVTSDINTSKMVIKIWSDVVCPFCYIGKRKLENALTEFEYKDDIIVEWHSFQLDPTIPAKTSLSLVEYLSERKGMAPEHVSQMMDNLTRAAKEVKIDFNFDKAIVSNTFTAHRLLQFAKEKGLGNETKEKLFHAYFTDGIDISSHDELLKIASSLGLVSNEVKQILNDTSYTQEVNSDIQMAREIGIRGVPFFILNDKYSISGAQDISVFKKALASAHKEWAEEVESSKTTIDGQVCTPDGECK